MTLSERRVSWYPKSLLYILIVRTPNNRNGRFLLAEPRPLSGEGPWCFIATYDVVVTGAGIEGSAAAYYLRNKGLNVLLLEQVQEFLHAKFGCRMLLFVIVLSVAHSRQFPWPVSYYTESLQQTILCQNDE